MKQGLNVNEATRYFFFPEKHIPQQRRKGLKSDKNKLA